MNYQAYYRKWARVGYRTDLAKGRAPRCVKLPNGKLRVRRADLEFWLESCLKAA